jgi:ion channel-forming bestrophin family protein
MRKQQWWWCEVSELFADPPFNEENWHQNRTWLRHAPQPLVCLKVTRSMAPILIWVVLVSTFVCLYAEELQPKGWPTIASDDYLQPFLLMSFAVSLLLVFRTNSSYGRWWEARKAYGMLYHVCRDLARLVRPATRMKTLLLCMLNAVPD